MLLKQEEVSFQPSCGVGVPVPNGLLWILLLRRLLALLLLLLQLLMMMMTLTQRSRARRH